MDAKYVIITPAKDEQETIEKTIESIIHQTVRPSCWVIVDDGSTDRTAEIVQSYLPSHGYMRLLKRRSGRREFGSKVTAFNAGYQLLEGSEHSFIGNLDADISLEPNYYERILAEFQRDPRLGIAGGSVHTKIGNRFITADRTTDSVAGAVQLFRKECFDGIGGYIPLTRGGTDGAAEIMARMNGWSVRKFVDISVYEHRRTGSAQHGVLGARYAEGICFHSLGYSSLFYLLRCIYRVKDRPFVLGCVWALLGFIAAGLKRDPICVPPQVVSYLRSEQMGKLRRMFFGKARTTEGGIESHPAR
jgi:glycosyltransferase involved in cell wall biosynthesis